MVLSLSMIFCVVWFFVLLFGRWTHLEKQKDLKTFRKPIHFHFSLNNRQLNMSNMTVPRVSGQQKSKVTYRSVYKLRGRHSYFERKLTHIQLHVHIYITKRFILYFSIFLQTFSCPAHISFLFCTLPVLPFSFCIHGNTAKPGVINWLLVIPSGVCHWPGVRPSELTLK